MPPKAKKKGKKKGKGKAKKDEGGELSVEEMYKRTLQEVGSLREQLAERKEYARQSRASEEVMRERVQEVREMVHEEQISKKDIAEELTRQYKTMRSEKDSHILYLQTEVKRLRDKLGFTVCLHITQRRQRVSWWGSVERGTS
ncbi:Coiled-coil domain-containing protein 153 [Geodia barretti]|uniref:Dynein regulatory complex protein 12 n=1 Tax=Geodia barretti TaxID=519541 RepID=A0AA35RZN8_GEOBA|nr:Coiled-coil domain-containing protein 153 [Geodia barretti]